MTESHPLPKIAKTAYVLLQQQFQQAANQIGDQAVEALGLDMALNWRVNLDAGTISRDIPDIEPKKVDISA